VTGLVCYVENGFCYVDCLWIGFGDFADDDCRDREILIVENDLSSEIGIDD